MSGSNHLERSAAPAAASLRVIPVSGRPVLALWRSNGRRSAALVSFADPFATGRVPHRYAFQLVGSDGQRVAGAQSAPAQTVARVVGDPKSPWMLRIWPEGADGSMPAVVILFLWGTAYFVARAMRRDTEVSRLQSAFVAAVSHEFRSPLTTVRQLSEMLEMGQVPSEERRHRKHVDDHQTCKRLRASTNPPDGRGALAQKNMPAGNQILLVPVNRKPGMSPVFGIRILLRVSVQLRCPSG